MSGLVVEVRKLRMAYGKVAVLEDVSLLAAPGEVIAVMGVNGAGKSTLLSCLAGLRRPAGGSVTVLGGRPQWQRLAVGGAWGGGRPGDRGGGAADGPHRPD